MCLAIPSKIVKIENGLGTIDVDGVQRTASLLLVEDAAVGDYVIVHAGFALHKIDEADAMDDMGPEMPDMPSMPGMPGMPGAGGMPGMGAAPGGSAWGQTRLMSPGRHVDLAFDAPAR